MDPEKHSSSGRRAADKTTLTISLPKSLKEAIEGAAESDARSVSNYLVIELEKLVSKMKSTQSPTKARRPKGSEK
jgi:hypothetical protein